MESKNCNVSLRLGGKTSLKAEAIIDERDRVSAGEQYRRQEVSAVLAFLAPSPAVDVDDERFQSWSRGDVEVEDLPLNRVLHIGLIFNDLCVGGHLTKAVY